MAIENKREEKKYSITNVLYFLFKSTQLLRTNSLENSLKKVHSEERREPSNTLNRTEQNRTTLNKNRVKNDHTKQKGRKETL